MIECRFWTNKTKEWLFFQLYEIFVAYPITREGSQVDVSKITIYLGWKFHSIGFLIIKFEFWRRFFPFQMIIISETSTRDPTVSKGLKKIISRIWLKPIEPKIPLHKIEKLSTSNYDLVLIYVCHFHHHKTLVQIMDYRDTHAYILDPCIQEFVY